MESVLHRGADTLNITVLKGGSNPMNFRLLFAAFILAAGLLWSISANARPDFDDSVETALNIYHSAIRQSEVAVAVVRSKQYEQLTSDHASEAAFQSAIWEGVKLSNPTATAEQRMQMASAIGSAKMVADASKGAALGTYISVGVDIDSTTMTGIDLDADAAFRLGYAQSLARERRIRSLKK